METRHLKLSAPAKRVENEYVMTMDVPPKLQMLEILETQPYYLESQHETTFCTGILGDVPHAVKLQVFRDYSEIYLGLNVRITTKPGELVHLAAARGVFVFSGDDPSMAKDPKTVKVPLPQWSPPPRGIPSPEPPEAPGDLENPQEPPIQMEEGQPDPLKFEDEVSRNLFQFRITSSPEASPSSSLGSSHIEFEGTRLYHPNEVLPPGTQVRTCGGFKVIIIREEGKLPDGHVDCSFHSLSGENSGKSVTCHFAKSRMGNSTLPVRDPASQGFEFFQAKCLWPSLPSRLHVVLKISKLIHSTIIDDDEEFPHSHPRGSIDSRPFVFSDEFSDVQIIVGGETIPAHKIILASRSRYFRAMFSTGMREAVEGVVHMEDEDPSLMRLLIRYIYAGELLMSEFEENMSELWILADKYDVEDLTRRIEVHLLQNLSADNMLEMFDFSLAIAKRGKLTKKAKQMIMWNKEMITGDRKTFREVSKKHPDLVFDLLKL